jgi:hypothetical protein
MFSALFFLVVLAWVVKWLVPGLGSSNAPQLDPQHTAELARLREEVDQLGAQLLRLQDEQSFMMRLLAEGGAARTPALPGAEAPESTTNPENS